MDNQASKGGSAALKLPALNRGIIQKQMEQLPSRLLMKELKLVLGKEFGRHKTFAVKRELKEQVGISAAKDYLTKKGKTIYIRPATRRGIQKNI